MSSADKSPKSSSSAVPEPIQRLVSLYAEHLGDVAFPEVDAARLEALVESVVSHARAVAVAEQALAEAREAHARVQAQLSIAAKRGLGYARVFVAEDEDLSAAFAQIELGRPSSPARRTKTTTKRKRAPTRDAGVTKLPFKDAEATSGAA